LRANLEAEETRQGKSRVHPTLKRRLNARLLFISYMGQSDGRWMDGYDGLGFRFFRLNEKFGVVWSGYADREISSSAIRPVRHESSNLTLVSCKKHLISGHFGAGRGKFIGTGEFCPPLILEHLKKRCISTPTSFINLLWS
jgi:hypothetical protein